MATRKATRVKKVPVSVLAYPAANEIFELTLNGDLPENQPLEMVRRDGYAEPEKWWYTGTKVTGKQTRRFKLVGVGYCSSFSDLKGKLAKHGEIPAGQWREAFKAKYPTPDENGPIGIPDASWVDPLGDANFPCVRTVGGSGFGWSDFVFSGGWRWLVEVRK